MQINVSSRHGHIASEVKDYAINGVENLKKYYNGITNVDVIIDQEKNNHLVELVAHVGHGSTLVAKHKGEVLMGVMEASLEKLERQVRKLKDRLRHHRSHQGLQPPVQEDEPEDSEEELFEGEIEFEKEL